MKFEHYLKKMQESPEYKNFRKKYKDEYLCAGFFILDFESGNNIHQIDYALPNGKIATFILDKEVKYKISEQPLKKKLPEISTEIKTDLDALKGIVEDEMKNQMVTEKIRKMIAILHDMDGKLIWNLQCILSGLEILLIHIDDADQSILKFEKHSLIDLLKSGGSAVQLIPKQEGEGKGEGKQGKGIKKISIKDINQLQEMLNKIKKKAEEKKAKEKQEKNK